jgi:hypothetical protein
MNGMNSARIGFEPQTNYDHQDTSGAIFGLCASAPCVA